MPSDHERLARCLDSEQFLLTTEAQNLAVADAVIVCVPTPVDQHFVPDLRALTAACDTVTTSIRPRQTLVRTSTTYVGSTRDLLVSAWRSAACASAGRVRGLQPEAHRPPVTRLTCRNGRRAWSAASPTRALAGSVDWLQHGRPGGARVSSPDTAELTKLRENTFRAVNIALANEFSTVARELNTDVMEAIDAVPTDAETWVERQEAVRPGGCATADIRESPTLEIIDDLAR